jgi:hypothetical protein
MILREPSWIFLSLFLLVLSLTGLAVAVFIATTGNPDWETAAGLATPAGAATAATAALIGPPLRRGQWRHARAGIGRAAAAWAVVGALWPALNEAAARAFGPIMGAPAPIAAVMNLVAVGGVTGALAGGMGAAFAYLACVRRS